MRKRKPHVHKPVSRLLMVWLLILHLLAGYGAFYTVYVHPAYEIPDVAATIGMLGFSGLLFGVTLILSVIGYIR